MFHVSHVSLARGAQPILRDVQLTISPRERIGLVGPNGAGKTTLLRIMAGLEPPDTGAISPASTTTSVGYLPQGFIERADSLTVGDMLHGSHAASTPNLMATWQHLRTLEDEMASVAPSAALFERYSAISEHFIALGGYDALEEADAVLRGLGLATIDQTRSVASLSGGQKTRAALAHLLLCRPALLLLDEPTNHLDSDALTWLEGFLGTYSGAVVVVSHDRTFLDNTVQVIWALDPATQSVRVYPGTYTAYQEARVTELTAQAEAYRRQQEFINRVQEDIQETTQHARSIETETVNFHYRKQAAVIARRAVVRQRKLERLLDSTDHIEKPAPAAWALKVDLPTVEGGARRVLSLTDVVTGYADTHRAVLTGVTLTLLHEERVVLTGPNGCGKSTLLSTIAGVHPLWRGTLQMGAGIKIGYFRQEHQNLDPQSTPLLALRGMAPLSETDARRALHQYLFVGDTVHTPIGHLSYGERARLSLATLVVGGATLLLLDEPLNHLDISAREQFEAALLTFTGTVLAVLHDRYATHRLATRVLRMEGGQIMPE